VIRVLAQTAKGSLIIVGIVETNVDRLRSGQPIHVDLGRMFTQSTEGDERPDHLDGTLQLAITYGTTHVAIIDEFRRSGVPIDDTALGAARKLDEQLRREGLL
jgi:hypothetical protein